MKRLNCGIRAAATAGLLALAATLLFGAALGGCFGSPCQRPVAWPARRAPDALLPGEDVIVDGRGSSIMSDGIDRGTGLLGDHPANGWLTFVLDAFLHQTCSEALRGSILDAFIAVWCFIVGALPGLFVVLIIVF